MSIGLLVGYAIMIIRKIIMDYDEPAKTSVGEVARYGYGRTERPCGRLIQTRGVNLLGTKAQRRGTRADVLPMAAGSHLVTDDCSKSSVHAMAGSA